MKQMMICLMMTAGMVLLVGCQPTPEELPTFKSVVAPQATPQGAAISSELLKDAKDNQVALLKQALADYQKMNVKDYTCTFTKQERMHGTLKAPQTIAVKFRPNPFAITMVWTKNPPMADKLLFVQGEFKNDKGQSQMVVEPTSGFLRALVGGSVLKLPDGPDALKETRRPCTEFGIENMLKNLIEVYEQADKAGHLEQDFLGYTNVGDVPCFVVLRTLEKKLPNYPAKYTEICLDSKTLLPLRVVGYDWSHQLDVDYMFTKVKFNVGLTDKDFTPEAVGIKVKK